VSETLEDTARRIADGGREALVDRLRPAFEEAAAARRDVLTLDKDQLEEMVQRAADRADGLQWRRALASVATVQLGIGLGEALTHPAVVRAHAIVGAPSYEEAPESAATPGAPDPEPTPEPDTLRLRAVHIGGIANLGAGEGDLELHLSRVGLAIVRGPEQATVGRLSWHEIVAFETTESARGLLRRRQRDARLVVRTQQGNATFEIRGVTPAELREQMAPLLAGG
jgi:hypothetical protein